MSCAMSTQSIPTVKSQTSIPLECNTFIEDVANYKPDGEKAKSHGIEYHDDQLTLTILECLSFDDFPFRITCEIEEAGKYDDVVLFYSRNKMTACRLIQLKHRANSAKKLTKHDLLSRGAFDLESYFSSYEKVADKFEQKFRCDIEDFVLSTNVDFDAELKTYMEMETDRLFVHRKLYRLKKVKTKLKNTLVGKIFQRPSVDQTNRIDRFFDRLKFAVSQQDGSDLKTAIRDEIEKCLKRNGLRIENHARQVDIVHTNFSERVSRFHSNPHVEVVTDGDFLRWIQDASLCCDNRLSVYHDLNMNRLMRHNLKFETKSVRTLKDDLMNINASLINVIALAGTIFTLIKIIDALEEKIFHIVTEKQLIDSTLTLQNDIRLSEIEYLIIENEPNSNTDNLLKIVAELDMKNMKILIVSDRKTNEVYDQIEDEVKWNDLDIESKQLLSKKVVNFQGKPVQFSKIDISHVENSISNTILSELFDERLHISKRFVDSNTEEVSYFIDRRAGIRNKVMRKLFQDTRYIFGVSNMDEYDFQSFLDELSLEEKLFKLSKENSFEAFNTLCKKYESKNVLWIHFYRGQFFLKRSSKPIDKRNLIDEKFELYVSVDRLTSIDDDTVLIIAEPGMGKSNLLSILALRSIVDTPDIWIIKIDLNNYTQYFYRMEIEKRTFQGVEEVIRFLSDTQEFRNDFERILFDSYFRYNKNITVLVDGFDEIAPSYNEIVIEMIKRLTEIRGVRLWITSRPQEKNYLESRLDTLAYSLVEFTENDQKMFFSKFWKNRIGVTETREHRLTLFIDRLLEITDKSLCDSDKILTGVPLRCRMLAEVYMETFRRYYDSDTVDTGLPETIDILKLYDEFVERIFVIYIEQKCKIQIGNLRNRKVIENERETLTESHKLLAVCTLFPKVIGLLSKTDLKNFEQYKQSIKTGDEKIGIVHSIKEDTPVFIHRTFAEYFAAFWFYDRLKRLPVEKNRLISLFETSPRKKLVRFLKRHLFELEHKVCRQFFDRFATRQSEVHTHLLNNDVVRFMKTFENDETTIRTVDEFGRNLLHLCAEYGSDEIVVEKLVRKGVRTTWKDTLFGWKPMVYAHFLAKDLSILNVLLIGNEADPSLMDYIKADRFNDMLWSASANGYDTIVKYLLRYGKRLKTRQSCSDGLFLASINGHYEICRQLVKAGANINHKDRDGVTPLHCACIVGNYDIVECLLRHGADINIIDSMYDSTPLHQALSRGQSRIMDAFLKYHPNVFQTIKCPEMLIAAAVQSQKESLVVLLIKHGFSVTEKCSYGSHLHVAVDSNSISIANILLRFGADINAIDTFHQTPLMISIIKSNHKMIDYLLYNGADIQHRSLDDETILHCISYSGPIKMIEYLIQNGVPVDAVDRHGETALHYASRWRNVDVLDILISNGASIASRDNNKRSALHFASRRGNRNAIDYLINSGVDVNIADVDGRTPLYETIAGRQGDMCRYLIDEMKADVGIVDKYNNSLLHWAAKYNYYTKCYGRNDVVFETLLENGVDATLKNDDGHTAYDILQMDKDLTIPEKHYYKCLIEEYS